MSSVYSVTALGSKAATDLDAGKVLNIAGTTYEATATTGGRGIIAEPVKAGFPVSIYTQIATDIRAVALDRSALTQGDLLTATTGGVLTATTTAGNIIYGRYIADDPDNILGAETIIIQPLYFVL